MRLTPALLLIAITTGCTGGPAPTPVAVILRNPEAFDGKPVAVCGVLTSGLENCSLAPDIGRPVPGQPGLIEVPPRIWVDARHDGCAPGGALPASGEAIQVQVLVTGTFETGARYGHLGSAKHQLNATSIEKFQGACDASNGS